MLRFENTRNPLTTGLVAVLRIKRGIPGKSGPSAPNAAFLAATKSSSAMDRWSGCTGNARRRIGESWMRATAQRGSPLTTFEPRSAGCRAREKTDDH